jgi:ubiquinone/menaquinone biosynthesis C-methylase UbiE
VDINEYHKMYELEDTHWYFVIKRKLINNLLKRIELSPSAQIADLGCGTGVNIQQLYGGYDSFGLDGSKVAVEFCHMRGLKNIEHGDINKLPYSDSQFDAVSMYDVLYHKLINPQSALTEAWRILKPGGYLIITDSAFNFLMSSHDIAVQARERFNKSSLESYLRSAGFGICYFSYAFFLTFPLLLTVRLLKRFFPDDGEAISDVKAVNKILNTVLITVLSLEVALLRFIPMPWGSTVLSMARKPKEA